MHIEEDIFDYLESTSLEPHDDYTSEFTYKEQKQIWNRLQEQKKEIKRLNNIIAEIDNIIDIYIDERIEAQKGMIFLKGGYESSMNYLRNRIHDKLKEIKKGE